MRRVDTVENSRAWADTRLVLLQRPRVLFRLIASLLATLLLIVVAAAAVPGAAAAASAQGDRWSQCKPKGAATLRRSGVVELYTLQDPGAAAGTLDLFACLAGQRESFGTSYQPEQGPFKPYYGPPMMQIAGHFLAYVSYGPCDKDSHICAPIGWVIDLRYDRYENQGTGRWGSVKVRVNERGSFARTVREPSDHRELYWPPGDGPFRVDVYDFNGHRTVDSGPGIDPLSLTMKGRRVTWVHDDQRRSTTVRDWPRPGRPHGYPGSGF